MHEAISDYRALQVSAPSAQRKAGARRKHFHAGKGSQRSTHSGFPDHNWFRPFPISAMGGTSIHICKSFMNFGKAATGDVDWSLFNI